MTVDPAQKRGPGSQLGNLFWERYLGISTRGMVDIDYPDAVFYAASPYRATRRILRQLDLGPSDTFVDLGCGKGRILCCAARHRIAGAVGVDVSKALCEIARANAARLRGRRAPVTVHNVPAQEFDYSEATVLYLFNPFGEETVNQVLSKLQKDAAGRPVRIAYAVPDFTTVFKDHDWLEPYHPAGRPDRLSEWVSFYRTRR